MKILKPIPVTSTTLFKRNSTGTYFDKSKVLQTAAANVPRLNWNPSTGVFEGMLLESAATNLLLNSASLSTQTRPVTSGAVYTLSFYGPGSITLTGAAAGLLAGAGDYPTGGRVHRTFTATSSSLTLSVSGSVHNAQLEAGPYPTSWIPTTTAQATRSGDLLDQTMPIGLGYTTFFETTNEWFAGTSYGTGSKVFVGKRKYESLVENNLSNYPPDYSTPGRPETKWLDIGPVNHWACLDGVISNASVGPGPLQIMVFVMPEKVDAIALMGLRATKVHCAVYDLDGVYATAATDNITATVVFTGIKPGRLVSLAIENSAGEVRVGEVLVGTLHTLGATQYGHSLTLTDYSRKDTDEFGTTTFVKRANAKRMSTSVLVPKANYNNTIALMESVIAQPTVYIASEDAQYSAGTVVYGFFEDFRLDISYPNENLCNLVIQGLI